MTMIRQAGLNTAAQAAERLGAGEAAAQLGRNVARIARNTGNNLLQDHARLKTNSLIVSSLILVLSRVFIANLTAQKTKGTPEGPLRYREAVRTTIREFCGWTFGYIILRWVQNMTKTAMKIHFGIKDRHGEIPKASARYFKERWAGMLKEQPLVKALSSAFKREKFTIPVSEMDTTIEKAMEFAHPERVAKAKGFFEKFLPAARRMGTQEFMETLMRWAPIAVGSVPAVLLAGYALERFTRDHSENVVDAISKRFGKNEPAKPDPALQPCKARQNFDTYLSRIHNKQAGRFQ